MIQLQDVQYYIQLKQRIAGFLQKHPDALHAPRAWSEGLAHFIEIDGEDWSYASEQDGWTFSQQDNGKRVFIASQEIEVLPASFSARELYEYLCCLPDHDSLTPIVVDMWLTNACMHGKASEAPSRGQFALV